MKTVEKLLSEIIKDSPWNGKVFIAGGYVRDEIMNLVPKDLDLTVAAPNGGVELANYIAKKLNIFKEGSNPVIFERFGTAKIVLNNVTYQGKDLSGIDIEFVTTRKEKYLYSSRKPEVEYGTLKEDIERRDFTVNSLLKNIVTREILDLTGTGIEDIKNGVIKTPLNPDIIFTEDPLRMLRAIRFSSKFGWKLPLFMIRAIKKNSSKLENISNERIKDELNKILVSKFPEQGIRLLQITELSKYIFPELDRLIRMKQNKYHSFDAMKHTLETVKKIKPEVNHRLAALFHDIGKGVTKEVIDNEVHFYNHEEVSGTITRDILTRLRYSTETIDTIVFAVENHMRTKQWGDEVSATKKALRKLKTSLGTNLELTLDLIDADNKSHGVGNLDNQISNLRTKLETIDIQTVNGKIKLPINGLDIMKLTGLSSGRQIGDLLKVVEEKCYEDPELTAKEAERLILIILLSL